MAEVQRFAAVIELRPEREADYRALHAAVWPDVLDVLRQANVRNYSIFLRDGRLFSYLEYTGSDYASDQAWIASQSATKRWWELTDPCQKPLDSAELGEWWAPCEEMFHLD